MPRVNQIVRDLERLERNRERSLKQIRKRDGVSKKKRFIDWKVGDLRDLNISKD